MLRKMSRSSLLACALAALAAAKTVPETAVTASTRACQPPHDTYPFCDTTLSLDARVKDLVSRIADADVPPQLTARHGGGGSPGPASNISAIGLPEWDWGLNAIHGVQSSCVRGAADGKTYCATSFMNPVNVSGVGRGRPRPWCPLRLHESTPATDSRSHPVIPPSPLRAVRRHVEPLALLRARCHHRDRDARSVARGRRRGERLERPPAHRPRHVEPEHQHRARSALSVP